MPEISNKLWSVFGAADNQELDTNPPAAVPDALLGVWTKLPLIAI